MNLLDLPTDLLDIVIDDIGSDVFPAARVNKRMNILCKKTIKSERQKNYSKMCEEARLKRLRNACHTGYISSTDHSVILKMALMNCSIFNINAGFYGSYTF